jgi:nucleoside-diphosphate-sugar epimerase
MVFAEQLDIHRGSCENNMKLAEQRVLVTGADGFIGSHLTEALVRGGLACARSPTTIPSIPGVGWRIFRAFPT